MVLCVSAPLQLMNTLLNYRCMMYYLFVNHFSGSMSFQSFLGTVTTPFKAAGIEKQLIVMLICFHFI